MCTKHGQCGNLCLLPTPQPSFSLHGFQEEAAVRIWITISKSSMLEWKPLSLKRQPLAQSQRRECAPTMHSANLQSYLGKQTLPWPRKTISWSSDLWSMNAHHCAVSSWRTSHWRSPSYQLPSLPEKESVTCISLFSLLSTLGPYLTLAFHLSHLQLPEDLAVFHCVQLTRL